MRSRMICCCVSRQERSCQMRIGILRILDKVPHNQEIVYITHRLDNRQFIFYVKSEEEMRNLFPYAVQALENTQKIAKRCNVEIEFGVTEAATDSPLSAPLTRDPGAQGKNSLFRRSPDTARPQLSLPHTHLVLLAENDKGYHNLMKIVSRGFTEGYYYKPLYR